MATLHCHAERFPTMSRAKRRWETLQERLTAQRNMDCILCTGWLDGDPHLLLVSDTLPDGFLDGETGEVRDDINPWVWTKMIARHHENRERNGPGLKIIRRPSDVGIRI